MPVQCNPQVGIVEYVVVSHPKHHVEHVDQVILVKPAVGVFQVIDVIDVLLVKLVEPRHRAAWRGFAGRV